MQSNYEWLTYQLRHQAKQHPFDADLNMFNTASVAIESIVRERDEAQAACRMALNAFERNDAIDWDVVARNASPVEIEDAGPG